MRRITHSRATLTIFISMVLIMVVAMTAGITLAAMSTSGYGKNTVYIADLGTVTCTTSVSAKLYPGGTSTATIKFALPTETNHATKVKLTNFKLTSFTLKWGTTSSTQATFSTVSHGTNSTTVTTTAGAWTFALNLGSGLEVTAGTDKTATLTITVPMGYNTSTDYTTGGSPANGYLVGSVTAVDCVFTVDVEPTAA